MTATSAPYWDATRERRLLVQWCKACDAGIHYPRARCPRCLGDALDWREASGGGVVHAVTVLRRGDPVVVVALVELDEGVRLLSNVVESPFEAVRVGSRVAVAWRELGDGRALPVFTVVEGQEDGT